MLKAADIMTREVVTIRSSATIAEALVVMRKQGIRALIVNRRHHQDAYGIITEADVIAKVTAFGRDPQQIRVFEVMTKPCITVNPDLGVEYVARLFTHTGIQRAPVIQGELLGIIAATDILMKGNASQRAHHEHLDQEIEDGIAQAQAICDRSGPNSPACAQAWQTVDEIQAEAAHLRAERLEKTAFEAFCEEYPEALQAKEYDAWCSG